MARATTSFSHSPAVRRNLNVGDLFEFVPEPHLVLTPDLIMVAANQARINATGIPRSEILGRYLFDVFPDNPNDPHADGVANLRASFDRVVRSRAPDAMPIQKYDIPKPSKDGGGFEERYWLPLNYPILSDSGEILWIVHRVEDVTERVRADHIAQQSATGQQSLISRLKVANHALALENSEKTKAQQSLAESEAWLRLLLDSTADGVYAVDKSGATILCNAAFLTMLQFEREDEALGRKLHDVIHHSRPDGTAYPRTECFIYRTAQTGEPAHVTGESFVRLDGTPFPVEYWVRPIMQNDELKGAVCTFIDVTEQQKAQERQELLVRELDHRVKNLFSIVTAIVSLSARSATSVQEMAGDVKGRVIALSAAHGLARSSGLEPGGTTTLDDLVKAVLAPHLSDDERVDISGPLVPLNSVQASGLALILHELGTNAIKHGAWGSSTGRITIRWMLSDENLILNWSEMGGPAVLAPPTRSGFGTVLANRTASSSLGGKITYDWLPSGLAVRLTIPIGAQ